MDRAFTAVEQRDHAYLWRPALTEGDFRALETGDMPLRTPAERLREKQERLKKISQAVDPAQARTDGSHTERGARPGSRQCNGEISVLGRRRGYLRIGRLTSAGSCRRRLAVMKADRAVWRPILAAGDNR